MDPGTIGVFVPIIAMMIPIMAIWTRHQRRMAELQLQNTAERTAQYVSSNKELEDRVRVLERIVTDKGYDVAAQIEALRDQRRVDDQLAQLEDRSR